MATSPRNRDLQALEPSFDLHEIDEMKHVFHRFDANGDGRISLQELSSVMIALGSNLEGEQLRKVFEDIDTDKDGSISMDEFAAVYPDSRSMAADGDSPELHDAFKMYDQDGNGLISAEELHLLMTRLGENFSLQDCSGMIRSYDSNCDGHISFEEFKNMMNRSSIKSSVN